MKQKKFDKIIKLNSRQFMKWLVKTSDKKIKDLNQQLTRKQKDLVIEKFAPQKVKRVDGFDEPIQRIIKALNSIDGLQTTNSCSGHDKEPPMIVCTADIKGINKLLSYGYCQDVAPNMQPMIRNLFLAPLQLSLVECYKSKRYDLHITSTLKGQKAYSFLNKLAHNIEQKINYEQLIKQIKRENKL